MNKDTLYIEPSDDITDIIGRLKDSKQKVVALVPPKKLGVLASAINIKLIAKAAKSSGKAVVLVTDNPSLMKLCAAADLPVAETLQSRPAVPTEDDITQAEQSGEKLTIAEEAEETEAREAKEQLAKEFTAEPESSAEIFEEQIKVNNPELDSSEVEDELAEGAAKDIKVEEAIEIKEEDEPEEQSEEPKKAEREAIPNFKKARKWIIAGALAALAIVAGLVWALVIAPNADIVVTVGTSSANFSETVSFTTKQDEEDAASGKFYLETLEYKETLTADLTPTGEKNIGEKAKGKVEVSYTFKSSTNTSITIPANSTFTSAQDEKSYKYTNPEKATLVAPSSCTLADLTDGKCIASASIDVIAAEPGAEYDRPKSASWSTTINGITVSNSTAISGGNTKLVKIVQQDDISKATSAFKKLSETDAKDLLKEQVTGGYIVIDSSYNVRSGEVKSSAKVGEEAGEGATVEQEVTYTIYAVDSERVTEFIRAKADIASDQKIYELGDPYIERFAMSDNSITGKLKTAYKTGPEITVEDVIEKVKGKKTGEAYAKLQSINGVKSVRIDATFNSIPDDINKIHVQIEVEK